MKSNSFFRPLIELIFAAFIILCACSLLIFNRKHQETVSFDDDAMIYQGTIENDRLNGQGQLDYANGDQYVGHFHNGAFDGYGRFTSHNGWVYEGKFVRGTAEGKGVLTTEDGTVYKGKFSQGLYVK